MEPHYDRTKWLEPEELRTPEMQIVPPPAAIRRRSIAQRALDGAGGLDDAELLRLVLGSKPRGGIAALLNAEPAELVATDVLSEAQAARLVGALELARRLPSHRNNLPSLVTASAVWNWVRPSVIGLRREVFRVLCLDAKSRLLRDVKVAEGSVDSCPVDPREVFGPAVACRASAVVLVHSHPSGDPTPSSQDLRLTEQLRAAGERLCVRVIDHVVVSEPGFVSMAQHRLL